MDTLFYEKKFGSTVTVTPEQIEYRVWGGTTIIIPINQIASVKILGGLRLVTVETTGGDKHLLPIKDKETFKNVVYQAMKK